MSGRGARFRRNLAALGLFLSALALAEENRRGAAVVVLANADDPGSLRIARHYTAARAVPPENIIALPLPREEIITWAEFVPKLWNPLLARLLAAGWIDGTPMALVDGLGRTKVAPRGHRIEALVVCRGVPLKIAPDPSRLTDVPPLTQRPEFRTNAGAVDSELSLLADPNYPITALIANPLYQNAAPSSFDRAKVVRVGRLDGPSVEDARALVDSALAGERAGLAGRAYIDLANRDPLGDGWLQATAEQVRLLGFDTDVDRAPANFAVHARFDAPALYFGWYSSELNGPFTVPGFRFPPGAIALHIHSFSATTLRGETRGWTAGFVARGVAATVGNVYEPYLQFTHRPDILLQALASGATWGEAVYRALPALSWQAIAVGDPLYRPLAVPLDAQGETMSAALRPYVTLRRARLLELQGRVHEARALLEGSGATPPRLPLALAAARLGQEAGDPAASRRALEPAVDVTGFEPAEWGLAREAAARLEGCDAFTSALGVWKLLLRSPALPKETRAEWLEPAARAAERAGDATQAQAWRRESGR